MEDIAGVSAASRAAISGSAGGSREMRVLGITATAGALDTAIEGAKVAAAGVARRCTMVAGAPSGAVGAAREYCVSDVVGKEDSELRLSPVEASSGFAGKFARASSKPSSDKRWSAATIGEVLRNVGVQGEVADIGACDATSRCR